MISVHRLAEEQPKSPPQQAHDKLIPQGVNRSIQPNPTLPVLPDVETVLALMIWASGSRSWLSAKLSLDEAGGPRNHMPIEGVEGLGV